MTDMVTEQELTLIREQQERTMQSRVIIKRPSSVHEDEGPKMAPIAVDIPARIKAGFGLFREIADRIQGITAFTITLPWNIDVRVGDEIVDEASVTYAIRDVRDRNTFQTAVQVLGDRIS